MCKASLKEGVPRKDAVEAEQQTKHIFADVGHVELNDCETIPTTCALIWVAEVGLASGEFTGP